MGYISFRYILNWEIKQTELQGKVNYFEIFF